MSSVNFGGLATGMDTESIITQLMKLERKPLERLESDQTFWKNRQSAFNTLDTRLKSLLEKFQAVDTQGEVNAYKATAASSENYTATAKSTAGAGSYNIEVQSLARQQKDVSDASYASSNDRNFVSGTLMIGGTEIAIDNDSLSILRDKINAANTGDNPSGVAASIINDGNGFRLVLTGTDASKPFTVSMTDGVTAEGYEPLAFSTTQTQALATIVVDGVTITSGSNTFENAIPGVTLTVTKPHAAPGDSTSLTVETDRDAVKSKIKDLVTAYNSILSFISEQKDSDWGRDSSLTGVRRNLQGLLTTAIAGTDSFATLSQLGLKTQRDGTLAIDNTLMDKAIDEDLGGIDRLLAGTDGTDGVAANFVSYLKRVTDGSAGLAATRQAGTDRTLKTISSSILAQEARLEKRETMLRAQFTAMEKMVSSLNSQGNYLLQQMSAWSTK
jgi:flagellar hook-associated protein 2